jgi:hypothetical protein
MFGHTIDEIVLRRVQANNGLCINFHTDYFAKTLQLALNDNFTGGELVYLTDAGSVDMLNRKQGTVTVHNNRIVHGVTRFTSGTRYSLFFLGK